MAHERRSGAADLGKRSGARPPLGAAHTEAPKTLTPDFTRFLAIVFLTSVAFVGVVNQIGNILPKVYGFSESQTATVVSVAGIAAIFFFFVAGRMLRLTNAVRTTATGVILRLVATLGTIAVAGVAGSILGGVLAGEFGYNAINWMAATASAGAVLLLTATTRRQAQATAS